MNHCSFVPFALALAFLQGDAWMGVTNCVEDQSNDHTLRIAKFSVAAIEAAGRTLIDVDDPGRGYVQIRAGFHSGSVLSNVIGSHNPRYALFGDTVNTASRMESNSTAGRILCSERAAMLLQRQDFNGDIGVEFRGLLPIKGKGDMNVYWVTQRQRTGDNSTDDDWEDDREAATTTNYQQPHKLFADDSFSRISI
jgi:class 3 adenylate cyclase